MSVIRLQATKPTWRNPRKKIMGGEGIGRIVVCMECKVLVSIRNPVHLHHWLKEAPLQMSDFATTFFLLFRFRWEKSVDLTYFQPLPINPCPSSFFSMVAGHCIQHAPYFTVTLIFSEIIQAKMHCWNRWMGTGWGNLHIIPNITCHVFSQMWPWIWNSSLAFEWRHAFMSGD